MRLLCEAGADVNIVCNERTPLHAAVTAENGYLEVVRILLDHGGDVNKFVEGQGTPVRLFLPKPPRSSLKYWEISGHLTKYNVVSNTAEAVHCC